MGLRPYPKIPGKIPGYAQDVGYGNLPLYLQKRPVVLYSVWNPDLKSGVKKSLVLEPGTSKISGRTSIYFHPMSGGQVKNSVQVYLTIYFGQVN